MEFLYFVVSTSAILYYLHGVDRQLEVIKNLLTTIANQNKTPSCQIWQKGL